jgi:hypothetical protein
MTARARGLQPLPAWLGAVVLPLGGLSLLGGMLAGLLRLGWDLPSPHADLALLHGPLMVTGFFGTLIALERAVALRAMWASIAPVLLGLGGATLVLGGPVQLAAGAFVLGSLVYTLASLWLTLRHRELFVATMALGGLCWLGGNVLWLLGWAVPDIVWWWAMFLVLTIAAERLELSRLLQPPPAARLLFAIILVVLLAGVIGSLSSCPAVWRTMGAGMIMLTIWLLRYDVARRTVRMAGLPRFTAVCLLSGYAWLGLAGVGALVLDDPTAGFGYDAVLHAVFLGFVFAMVFGHAPIILPAVARLAVPFRRFFYVPLILLHVALLLRVAGDVLAWNEGRMCGGLLGVFAILLFLASTAVSVRIGRRTRVSRTLFPGPSQ